MKIQNHDKRNQIGAMHKRENHGPTVRLQHYKGVERKSWPITYTLQRTLFLRLRASRGYQCLLLLCLPFLCNLIFRSSYKLRGFYSDKLTKKQTLKFALSSINERSYLSPARVYLFLSLPPDFNQSSFFRSG